MNKKDKSELIQPETMIKVILWSIFVVITIAASAAFIYFPDRVGYGFVATLIFRSAVSAILALSGFKFFYDMEKLNQLNKSR